MFPTHVGMNRQGRNHDVLIVHVPHTRGDEPIEEMRDQYLAECSPHTWG